ncbi:MAG: response regulator transcription factor [Bacteroidia bacterium]|nr:response regulator transcription factor [Bacteroidia bacterium]
MKAIIVDDEDDARGLLNGFLELYCPSVEVLGDFGDPVVAFHFLEKHHNEIDLIYLDISMPHLDGLTFLKQSARFDCDVVFITAYDQYAIQAIRLAALDYILKPIDITALINATNRAESLRDERDFRKKRLTSFLYNHGDKANQKILLNTGRDSVFVPLKDIVYIKADGNYSHFILASGKSLLITKQLGRFEEMLDSTMFIRTHRTYLVNLAKVVKYQKSDGRITLSNGETLVVSSRRRGTFLKAVESQSI